jgi:Na+/H+ antiporter NhaD/arsenite permease-like protein
MFETIFMQLPDISHFTYLSVVILAIVFVLIAIRQVGRFRLRIWQIMLAGAIAVLFTGQISPREALAAINVDVMVFLFGMFVLGEALSLVNSSRMFPSLLCSSP